MRPWIMQACHSTASCHLGTARTLRMLERLLVDRYEHLHPVVVPQLLEVPGTENVTADGPVAHRHLALTRGPGIAVSIDYFNPLPVTPRGNTYMMLFTDSFSRRADTYAVTAAEFTAEGTGNVLIDRYIPLWGCPRSILSGNALQICSRLSHAVYQLIGVRKNATSSYPTQTSTVGWNV